MLSFIVYKTALEELEIVADSQGIDDLIHYLQGIKKAKDHMHLIIGSEINEYPINDDRKDIVDFAKQVRIEYADTNQWDKRSK